MDLFVLPTSLLCIWFKVVEKKNLFKAARSTLKKGEVEHNIYRCCIYSTLWLLIKFKGFYFSLANTPGHVGDFYLCPLRIKITSQPPHILTNTWLSAFCQSKGDKRHNSHLLRVSVCCLKHGEMEVRAQCPPPSTHIPALGHLHIQEAT